MTIVSPINNKQNDVEISLRDILKFVQKEWRWLFGGALVGIFLSASYLAMVPKKYEAQGLFQGAKVLGVDLEGTQPLIERLKFPTFYAPEQLVACDVPIDQSPLVLVNQIKVEVLKGTSILRLSYQARSRENAIECLASVVGRLIDFQNKKANGPLEEAKRQLELTKAQLEDAETLLKILERRSMNSLNAAETKFSQMLLVMSTSLFKKDQVTALRKSVLEQAARLEPPATEAAAWLEPIYAPDKAVAPKRLPTLAGGLLGGLILGGVAFWVRRSWLARK